MPEEKTKSSWEEPKQFFVVLYSNEKNPSNNDILANDKVYTFRGDAENDKEYNTAEWSRILTIEAYSNWLKKDRSIKQV